MAAVDEALYGRGHAALEASPPQSLRALRAAVKQWCCYGEDAAPGDGVVDGGGGEDDAVVVVVVGGGGGKAWAGRRAVFWRVFMGLLPAGAPGRWKDELSAKRLQYREFLREFKLDDEDAVASRAKAAPAERSNASADGELMTVTVSDPLSHPLCSSESNSEWNEYFKDKELMEQIDKDVHRTHPDIEFFSAPDTEGVRAAGSQPSTASATQQQQRSAHVGGYAFNKMKLAMRRMLFVYAKLNPGLKYVQGMNELLAPILYCYATAPEDDGAGAGAGGATGYDEGDAFFSLVDLFSEFRDYYCKQLDDSSVGIKATLENLSLRLRRFDPQLASHLDALGISSQFYAFRWVTLIFTQEFSFHDTLVLWDYLLADNRGRIECIIDIACSMLLLLRERLLHGDFATNVKLLQGYPTHEIGVRKVMRMAERMLTLDVRDVHAAIADIMNEGSEDRVDGPDAASPNV